MKISSRTLQRRFELRSSVYRLLLRDGAAQDNVFTFFPNHVAALHSVVTAHPIATAGSPALDARDEILAFLRRRLTKT